MTSDDIRAIFEGYWGDISAGRLENLEKYFTEDAVFEDTTLGHVWRGRKDIVGVPVVAKSVGSGISVSTARRLLDAGVAAIDVAGAGGTSWARVEGRRAGDPARHALAETFAGWGYPTAEATRDLRLAFPHAPLVASGGVRTGIDVAKAIAIGADLCGMALPFLEPATRSAQAVSAATVASCQTATPRQMASSAGCRSAGRTGSNTQSSCPFVASRAMTRSNGVQKTSLPAARIGVTSKELRVKAVSCRAASPV